MIWTSLEKELPPSEQQIFCYDEISNIAGIGIMSDTQNEDGTYTIRMAISEENYMPDVLATHWMPIPPITCNEEIEI